MEFTSETTSSFTSNDRPDDTLSLWNPWSPSPSHPTSRDSDSSLSRTELAPESLAVPPYTFHRGGYGHTMPTDYTPGQDMDIRGASDLLDTRMWAPSPSLVASYVHSGSHLALVDMSSHAPLPRLVGDSDGPTRSFDGKLAPDLGSNYHQEHPGYPTFPKDNLLASSSSYSTSGSTEDRAGFLSDETQPPAALHRSPERKVSGCGRGQRACAINIEDLWIDKDDLHPVAGRDGNMISVHECQWAKSTIPCGMWIIGSRARVGAHVRKWHGRTYATSGTQCLWEGCTAQAMSKDSINRHVVTVHLGERFSCRGCNQNFSRKDVYDKHVRKGEQCRDAGAVMVYGTERRMIDTRMALHQGGAVRYADRHRLMQYRDVFPYPRIYI